MGQFFFMIFAAVFNILRYEAYFRRSTEQRKQIERQEEIRIQNKQLARYEKRIAALKRLFIKIYEDADLPPGWSTRRCPALRPK